MTRSPDILFLAEYIKNVLYFATVRQGKTLKDSSEAHYFSIDDKLVYENYYSDFGPLNLGCVYKYCTILDEKLKQYLKKQIVIVHYTSVDPKKKANAAFLLGCYGVLYLSLQPKDAIKPLLVHGQSYRPFQDATQGDSSYTISLLDCLNAIAKARNLGFFNFQDFNYDEYERLGKIQGGDLNWIVPGKFLAFIGPVDYSVNLYHPPEMYIDYFMENDVQIVIRLNKRLYDSSVFSNMGMVHYDLFFPDGSCPPRHILLKFLQISEKCEGAIAVHCKAGLGRTGSLIGCYLMKHYRMSAREAIGWMRICRPGSVIGQQQGWLERLEAWLIKQGNLHRKNVYHDIDRIQKCQYGVYSIIEKTHKQRSSFNKSPSPPPPIQRETRSDTSNPVRPNISRSRDGPTVKGSKSPIKKEQFEWYVTSSPVKTYINKTQDNGEANSTVLRRSGAGEPRVPRSSTQGRFINERSKSKNKEPAPKTPISCYRIPTFLTTQGPAIKTVTDAKHFLMKSSMQNKDTDSYLKSSITVTPHYTSRINNFLNESNAVENTSHFTPSYFNTVTKLNTQQQQRRRLGRSPSPNPVRIVTEKSRATNTPVHNTSEKFIVKESKTNIREALSRLKVANPCNGSVGAASLGARREAPSPRRAPSVRSDERPLATQGDMLNSIKFQRRFRDTLQEDKVATLYHGKNCVLSTTSKDMSSVKSGKSSGSGTKSRVTYEYCPSQEKMAAPRNFFRATRPSSPKGQRSMQPSFY